MDISIPFIEGSTIEPKHESGEVGKEIPPDWTRQASAASFFLDGVSAGLLYEGSEVEKENSRHV